MVSPRRAAAPVRLGGLRVTHPQRVIDRASGLTKLDVVRYYAGVAHWLVPQLRDRPCSLVRGPTGVDGELFFQKHLGRLRIPEVRSLPRSLWPDQAPLLEVPSARALAAAAQMNVLEFHTWNARIRALEKPDRMIFDLDPGEGTAWARVREAAAILREQLVELGLASWLKTSGGKGLHVVVPLAPRHGWGTLKGFAQAVVLQLAEAMPERFVAKSGPANRVGRIFIDTLRNTAGATTAAAYSARARPGLGVSMPVDWAQLDTLTSGAHWTVATAFGHLAARERDPWDDLRRARQTLTRPMRLLGFTPQD